MIRFDNLPPEVMQAMCTPMHLILPPSSSTSTSSSSSSSSSTTTTAQRTGALYLGSLQAILDPALLATHAIGALVQVMDAPWLPGVDPPSASSPPLSSPPLSSSTTSSSASTSATSASSTTSTSTSAGGQGQGGGTGRRMERYRLDILDSTTADLKPHLEATVRWIDERLKRGVNVLVHCQQGVSRSSAVVIAYLIYTHHMSYDAAFEFVRRKRACVKPNSGFVRCLQEWERQWRPAQSSERPGMRRAQTTPH